MSRLFFAIVAVGFFIPSGLLLVAQNPAIVDPQLRTFRFFYWDLGNGMNRAEVDATVEKWYPPEERANAPRVFVDNAHTLEFVLTPRITGRATHERVVLKMEAGLIVGKEYLSDR